MISKRRRPIIIVTSIILGVICAAHIWDARYHFRMVPLPLWAYEAISEVLEEKIFTPPPTKSFTNKLPLFDFDTKLGREEALEYVRKLVPNFGPRMTYENLSIESWFSRIQVKNGYCTDFSILLISLAAKAGLPAREWILWHDNQWSLGSAHSIVEIRLSNGHWIAMDGQHATILTSASKPISMAYALKLASTNQPIETRRLAIADEVGLPKAASTKSALQRLPAGVMLNLHLGSWTGTKHLPVLAIPIIYGDSKIDWRIWTTKLALLLGCFAFGVVIFAIRRR
ncbi:MAG: hypothetical protein GKS01_04995 [Alphaproteobacteria bacterium]|nr:hypothetical protein [Alphaproteobacteria bacterium]